MICYECGQPAIGQCKNCGKFYCQDHGDVICQACAESPAPVPQEKRESFLRSCLVSLGLATVPLWGPLVALIGLLLLASLAIWMRDITEPLRERTRHERYFDEATAAWGSSAFSDLASWRKRAVSLIEYARKYDNLVGGIDNHGNWPTTADRYKYDRLSFDQYVGTLPKMLDLIMTEDGREELKDLGEEYTRSTVYLKKMEDPETGIGPGTWTREDIDNYLRKIGLTEEDRILFWTMADYFEDPEAAQERGVSLFRALNRFIDKVQPKDEDGKLIEPIRGWKMPIIPSD
jgi:hypothetical protein